MKLPDRLGNFVHISNVKKQKQGADVGKGPKVQTPKLDIFYLKNI
jgi:hypothetical protein